MDSLCSTVEKIYSAFIRVDEEIQEIIIIDETESYHCKNLLNSTNYRARADHLILFTRYTLIDINFRIENEDLFIEV